MTTLGFVRSPGASFGRPRPRAVHSPTVRLLLVLAAVLVAGPAREARADWLITPFVGTTFGADTAYLTLDLDARNAKHFTFGGSVALLSDQVFGVEADLGFAPGFFQSDAPDALVQKSRVTTLFGTVIAALPISVTQDSLRPYLLGGLGVVWVYQQDPFGLANGQPGATTSLEDRSLGLQLGGGAVGMLSQRAGVRFDLRQIRTLSRTDTILGDRATKLSFWRATVGAVIRY